MLRQNNLDDMRFDEISRRAWMNISEYFPQWSDLNTHDPGVTLIELFAWLTEQQRFYMDQSEEAYPFFPLMGITLRRAAAAETEILIPGGFKPSLIPESTPLYAEDVRFETLEDVRYNGVPAFVRIIQRETVKTPVILGVARGYPDESFTADTKGQLIYDLSLMVAGDCWTVTDDFRGSRPFDKHYTLNHETGEITFGDGIHGALPCGEVAVTYMTLTRGPDGNIAPERISELAGLPVSQPKSAEGGAARETVAEALKRSTDSLRRAVTAEDIERLVLETPGLDILRAHAFVRDSELRFGEPRTINIAVLLGNGALTDKAKNEIRKQLEPYRLVCRDFVIADPKTVRISLTLELRAGLHGSRFKESMEASIRAFFAKQYGGFGAMLRVSELYALAADIPEVKDVTRCAFRVHGGARTSAGGDVTLEPDALAELSEVTIRILTE